jgi:tetratricopeptide (TPR) repeat protein
MNNIPNPLDQHKDLSQQLIQLNKEIKRLLDCGEYENALKQAEEAAEYAHSKFGKNSEEYSSALVNLANLMSSKKEKLKSAESLLIQAQNIREKIFGINHPKVGEVQYYRWKVSLALGNLSDAHMRRNEVISLLESVREGWEKDIEKIIRDEIAEYNEMKEKGAHLIKIPKYHLQAAPAVSRPQYYIWICDCSNSMRYENKMEILNKTTRDLIYHIKKMATHNPKIMIFMNILKVSSSCEWVDYNFLPLDRFEWNDLKVQEGTCNLGEALAMVAGTLKLQPEGKMEFRSYPPIVVLTLGGCPTSDWENGFRTLMEVPWGKKATRIVISLPGSDKEILKKFVGDVSDFDKYILNSENDNTEDFVNFIESCSKHSKSCHP